MLWALGRPLVVLPVVLVEAGSRDVWRSVLGHELAHLKRRDHWGCWLELIGSCVWWWLPTFWWARSQMRRAADEAADAQAVQAVNSRKVYAESLLATVQLLSAGPLAVPVLGRGLGERQTLARRLTMIMREPLCNRLSWSAWIGTALVGLLVLPASPGRLRAQDPPQKSPAVPSDKEVEDAIAPNEDAKAAYEAAVAAFNELIGQDRPQPRDGQPGAQRPPEVERGRGGPPDAGSRGTTGRPGGGQGERGRGGSPEAGRGPRQPEGPGQRDSEGRLRELEEKMDRVLRMLEGMQGGPGRGPGGPAAPGSFPGGPPSNRSRPTGLPEAGPGPGGGPQPGAPGDRGPGSPGPGSRGPGGGPPPGAPPVQPVPGVPGQPGPGPGHDDFGRLLGQLDLSPEQRERVEKVQHEFQARMQEIEHKRHEAIRDVLTPEQRERLERMHAGREGGREHAEPGRRPDGERPREGAESRRRPEGERPREGAEPRRRPEGERRGEDFDDRVPTRRDRPREGGEPPRRPEGGRSGDGAEVQRNAFEFFVGLFR